jgi:hypothetical protein
MFPIVELPDTPITDNIMYYVDEANKALNDGRYGDVVIDIFICKFYNLSLIFKYVIAIRALDYTFL